MSLKQTPVKKVALLSLVLVIGLGAGFTLREPELVALRQPAFYWKQATAIFEPVQLKTMTDHIAYATPDGLLILAYHFDDMDLSKAQNLNWVVIGVKGKWCSEDQQRIEKQLGPGFTHFHNVVKDTHGGTVPGEEGYWFKHIAVRSFFAPWGALSPGVDSRFMPTVAPSCSG